MTMSTQGHEGPNNDGHNGFAGGGLQGGVLGNFPGGWPMGRGGRGPGGYHPNRGPGGHGGRGGARGQRPDGNAQRGHGGPFEGPHGQGGPGGGRRGGPRGRGEHGFGQGRDGRWNQQPGSAQQEIAQAFAEFVGEAFGGKGFGPGGPRGFAQGFGPGRGPRPGGRGGGRRRARRGDVRVGILLLLSEAPLNGYGIMRALAERSGGEWAPSSGAVYPALSQLEDEGLIVPDLDAGPKHFALTDSGREEAEKLAEKKAPWDLGDGEDAGEEPEGSAPGREMADSVRQAMLAMRAVMATGDEELIEKAKEQIDELRRELYALLAENG